MNLNDFIDRSEQGCVRVFKGHQVHIQAAATTYNDEVVLLLLQGRPTNARAAWAMFHEGDLHDYRRLEGKDTYVKPNPTARLAQGDLEIVIAHIALFPLTVKDWDGPECYTFGPPHFAAIFQAAMPVPFLPHWETALWEMGQRMNLIKRLRSQNTEVWQVQRDPKQWLECMAIPRWQAHWTYAPDESTGGTEIIRVPAA